MITPARQSRSPANHALRPAPSAPGQPSGPQPGSPTLS